MIAAHPLGEQVHLLSDLDDGLGVHFGMGDVFWHVDWRGEMKERLVETMTEEGQEGGRGGEQTDQTAQVLDAVAIARTSASPAVRTVLPDLADLGWSVSGHDQPKG